MSALMTAGRSWTLTIAAPSTWTVKPGRRPGTRLGPDDYKLQVRWLNMNRDVHRMVKHRYRKEWQEAIRAAARVAVGPDGRTCRLPQGQVRRARVDMTLHFIRATRRDTSNWQPTGKALVDALTKGTRTHPGYGFMPDDEPLQYLHCEDCPHLHKAPQLIKAKPPFGPGALVVVTLTEMIEEMR